MARLLVSFTGNNGTGAISIPGLKAADQVITVILAAGNPVPASFAPVVIADGELLQVDSGNLSSDTCYALIDRHVVIG